MKTNYLKIIILNLLLLVSALKGYSVTFIVDNIADTDNLAAYTAGDGSNTLRKCIRLANANANSPTVDIISFASLPGAGPFIFVAATPYQFISDPVNINGFTAPGSVAPTPLVAIKGSGAAAAPSPLTNAFNFTAGGSNSTLRGFAIYRTTNDGVYINAATNITIEGCWIGLTEAGALPGSANSRIGGHGIYLTGASNNCKIGTTIARNVISGASAHGVVAVGCSGVSIKNNYVGTNTAGTAAIANTIHGINLDNSPSAVIGGGLANEGNLVSGNTQSGIIITNASSNAVIRGNKIGTNITGTVAIPNGESGINIFTNVLNTIIGGNGQTAEGNLLSGNALNGINIDDLSTGTIIRGNKIGTNLAGTAAIGNLLHGVYIQNSNNTTIGGSTKADRNIISGNGNAVGENGVGIVGCNGHTIQGNFFGTSVTGLAAIPNSDTGLSMTNSSGNTIGGASYMQRNVCSGNSIYGLYLFNVDNTTITGNYIGTDSTGNLPLGNTRHGGHSNGGCDLNAWTGNVVGGNGDAIAGNGLDLLFMTNSTFYGNYFGLGINGVSDVGNFAIGLRFGSASTGNIIGGSGIGQRNYMSGNGNHGMMFDGQSSGNTVKGNYVGCDITGLIAVPNQTVGLMILDGADNLTVGGTAAGEGNIFCCSVAGAGIQNNISSSSTFYGNLIGVDKNAALTPGFGNFEHGIFLVSYSYLTQISNSNTIGGLAAGRANVIANNGMDGVRLAAYPGPWATTESNSIIGNKIYCNGGFGINMENNSGFENQGVPAPVVTISDSNYISGTGVTGNTIHVYRNQFTDGARCDCEGEIYVGTTTVAGGTWTLVHGLDLTVAQALSVTATQTNATNSTSEFWVCSVPLPVDLLSLEAKRKDNIVEVNFTVTEEKAITIYHILRSKDGVNFEMIGSVIPKNEQEIHSYSFEDSNPLNGISYYRIQTVENDGRVAHSKIVQTNNSVAIISIFPNPATDEVTIASVSMTRIELSNALGQMVFEKDITTVETTIQLSSLAGGIYFVKVFEGAEAKIYKLEKK